MMSNSDDVQDGNDREEMMKLSFGGVFHVAADNYCDNDDDRRDEDGDDSSDYSCQNVMH